MNPHGPRCSTGCVGLAGKMPAMRAACLLLLLPFASGCNYVLVSGGTLYVSTGPAVASMATVGALVANVDARNNFPAPSGPAPEMLGERAVAERDCTKPIEDWSANLKCR
jgi:hypothetical protein